MARIIFRAFLWLKRARSGGQVTLPPLAEKHAGGQVVRVWTLMHHTDPAVPPRPDIILGHRHNGWNERDDAWHVEGDKLFLKSALFDPEVWVAVDYAAGAATPKEKPAPAEAEAEPFDLSKAEPGSV